MRRALELNPNFALAHALLGASLANRGANQEAIDSAQRALQLSPNDRSVGVIAASAMAGAHFGARRYAESVRWARIIIETNPEYMSGPVYLTAALAMHGEMTPAIEARDALLRLRPEMSIAWHRENAPMTEELAERVCEGLRRAGVPEG